MPINPVVLQSKGKLHVSIVRYASLYRLGDNVRTKNISRLLEKAGFQVSTISCPQIDRIHLLSGSGATNAALNILPLQKSSNVYNSLSLKNLAKNFEFTVSINYLTKAFKKLKPDVVLAETSYVGWLTTIAAKRLSIPCIIDVHGLAFAEARGESNQDWGIIREIEKEAFVNADYIIAVSNEMRKYLSEEIGIEGKKIMVAPNGCIFPNTHQVKYKKPMNVVYAGTFAYWEKVTDFLDLAKKCDRNDFSFYLAGDGPYRDVILKRINEEKIPIQFMGYIPKTKISSLFANMQVGIVPSTKDLARQVASPIKVFDYMSYGLPVVTPKIGDWGDLIAKEDCGIALEVDTIENYENALRTLSTEKHWQVKSQNAINISSRYSWEKTLQPIVSLILQF